MVVVVVVVVLWVVGRGGAFSCLGVIAELMLC